MSDVSLSIIVPTIGRGSLKRLLLELAPQMNPSDEVLVVADGIQPVAREIAKAFPQVRYLEIPEGPTKDWGHSPRNFAMPRAKGTHLWSVDDDDRVAPNAVSVVRSSVSKAQDRIHIFRMHHFHEVIWQSPTVREGRVSTQLFVVPNIPGRLGRWGRRYEGDFDFIMETVGLHPEREAGIVWRQEIIALHRIASNSERDPAVARWNGIVDDWRWTNNP